jgi:hypothetical protein
MARITDHDKLAQWRMRIERFQASGLTVADFCQREQVSTAAFYYWQRKLREASMLGSPEASRSTNGRNARGLENRTAEGKPLEPSEHGQDTWLNDPCDRLDREPRIEVTAGDGFRVSIPADRPQVLVTVLEHLLGSSSQATTTGFERIDLGSLRGA